MDISVRLEQPTLVSVLKALPALKGLPHHVLLASTRTSKARLSASHALKEESAAPLVSLSLISYVLRATAALLRKSDSESTRLMSSVAELASVKWALHLVAVRQEPSQ